MLRRLAAVLAVTTIVTYAINYALTALAMTMLSPFSTLTLRMGISALVLWGIIAAMRRRIPRGRQLWHALGAGTLVQGGQFVGSYWALSQGVSAGIVALVIAMTPVATALLSATVLRKRDSVLGVVAVIVGAIAVIVACLPKIAENPSLGPGIVAVVAAMAALAIGSLWQGAKISDVDPISFTAIGVTVAIVPSALLIFTEVVRLPQTPANWVLLIAITLIGVAGTSTYAGLVRTVGARSSSVIFAIIPACTAVMAGPIDGEAVTIYAIIGFVFGATACAMRFIADGRQAANARASALQAQPQRGLAH